MDSLRRNQYLEALGIPAWQLRAEPVARGGLVEVPAMAPPESAPAPAQGVAPRPVTVAPSPVAQMDWTTLVDIVKSCTACGLRAGCTQTVFGVGSREASLLVVGEGPGADEDRIGEPFVGRAGKLLDSMLLAIGRRRDAVDKAQAVFIANVVKCRPPNNRDPLPDEANACRPYLERQIELLKPRLILAVGRVAAQNLLQTDTPIGKLRGDVHRYGSGGIPVIVTYHPAYLLRSPREKGRAWEDLKRARALLRETA